MSIGDGFVILKGANNAATQYLMDKTTAELKQKFAPIIQAIFWPMVTALLLAPQRRAPNPDENRPL
jgi:hypothetical protein